jgi:hypothetical protein
VHLIGKKALSHSILHGSILFTKSNTIFQRWCKKRCGKEKFSKRRGEFLLLHPPGDIYRIYPYMSVDIVCC